MDYPRPASPALTDVASQIMQRQVSPQLNPLEEFCLECGRLDDQEFQNRLHHCALTDASAFAEVTRRAAAHRNNPMSYKHLMSRPPLPNEAFPRSYSDWQVAGDPGNAHLMQERAHAKWPVWEPMETTMVPTQFLPPPVKCSRCDVGTSKLRRRQEDIIVANMHHQGVISPESAPELSSRIEKHYEQPSGVQSAILRRRYQKKILKDGNLETRDGLFQNRRVRKGTKSHSIPIDESTTHTEAAVYSRAAPQMKERPQTAAQRLLPEAMREAKQRLAERSGPTGPSESSGTDRRQAETQALEVIAESVTEERPKSSASEKINLKDASKSKSGEKLMTEVPKPPVPPPPLPLTLDSERFGLRLPMGLISVEDVPEDDAHENCDNQETGQTCEAVIDRILAEKGMKDTDFLASLKDRNDRKTLASDRPCQSLNIDSHEEKLNELNVAKSTEVKASGTETRVVTPNKSSPSNSPETTLDETVSRVEEDNMEESIAIMSQMSVNDKYDVCRNFHRQATKSISSCRDSRKEISSVVKNQVKWMRLGLEQLETLIGIQSMMDESTESKQSNSELA